MAIMVLRQKKQAKKGRDLEIKIEHVLDQINAYTDHLAIRIEVRQARTSKGLIHAKKQPFDYLVVSPGNVWGFDAKECSERIWYPGQAPHHQKEAFRKLQKMRYRAGFLVWFRMYGDLPQAYRFIESFDEPANVDSGIQFGWEMILGAKQ